MPVEAEAEADTVASLVAAPASLRTRPRQRVPFVPPGEIGVEGGCASSEYAGDGVDSSIEHSVIFRARCAANF